MKLLTLAFTAGLAVLMSGCAALRPPVQVHPIETADKPTFVDLDATRRGYIILPRPDGKGFYVLAEPSPEAALATVNKILAEVSVKNGSVPIDAKTQIEFNTAVIQLASKSQTVLFLRESLYRLNEQSVNQTLPPEEIAKLYETAMLTALKMAETELAKQQTDLAKLLADPGVRDVWNQVFGQPPSVGGTPVAPPPPAGKKVPDPAPSTP